MVVIIYVDDFSNYDYKNFHISVLSSFQVLPGVLFVFVSARSLHVDNAL